MTGCVPGHWSEDDGAVARSRPAQPERQNEWAKEEPDEDQVVSPKVDHDSRPAYRQAELEQEFYKITEKIFHG